VFDSGKASVRNRARAFKRDCGEYAALYERALARKHTLFGTPAAVEAADAETCCIDQGPYLRGMEAVVAGGHVVVSACR